MDDRIITSEKLNGDLDSNIRPNSINEYIGQTEVKDNLNLTDEEEVVFIHLSKGRSKVAIADRCMISISTVDNRIKSINAKLSRISKQ